MVAPPDSATLQYFRPNTACAFSNLFLNATLRNLVNNEGSSAKAHLAVLDGWRGISILLVLLTHLLPLGPRSWRFNDMFGSMGMALFFTLSGFLITQYLVRNSCISDFLIRRFFRIIPLAWIAMVVALTLADAPSSYFLPSFLFYANLPPQHLTEPSGHLWSVCVEMQFYVGIALLVGVMGRRGLYLLPLLSLAVTANRISEGVLADIVTWHRIDEILAGAVLAMAFEGKFGPRPAHLIGGLNAYVLIGLLVVCSHPDAGFMNYLRPYVAASLVGVTLFGSPAALEHVLKTRTLAYIATISYALYVIHNLLAFTWLGSGERLEKYLKRPLLLAITFALAHISTFHYEKRWMALGKRLSLILQRRRSAAR